MNLKEAELLFQAGALEALVIRRHDSGAGWIVTLDGRHRLNPMLETAHGQISVFKRLDAVVGVLLEVGFGEAQVVR